MSSEGSVPHGAGRVLVAGLGNVLRGDDGFGVVVARRLQERRPPDGVRVVEAGIAGISLVQELLTAYDGLVVVDALARGRPPGTLHLVEPRVPDPAMLSDWDRREFFADMHQVEPTRALMLARALGCLPARILVVGCEPAEVDELHTELTPAVRAAVDRAVDVVLARVRPWLTTAPVAKAPA